MKRGLAELVWKENGPQLNIERTDEREKKEWGGDGEREREKGNEERDRGRG